MTLRIEDIEHDIQKGIWSGIEDAFRALVNWPGEDDIPDLTPDQRRDLLNRICDLLVDGKNGRQMPHSILDMILDEAEDMDGGTYADGARAVRRCPVFFDRLEGE